MADKTIEQLLTEAAGIYETAYATMDNMLQGIYYGGGAYATRNAFYEHEPNKVEEQIEQIDAQCEEMGYSEFQDISHPLIGAIDGLFNSGLLGQYDQEYAYRLVNDDGWDEAEADKAEEEQYAAEIDILRTAMEKIEKAYKKLFGEDIPKPN